jgi:hypothetical protein
MKDDVLAASRPPGLKEARYWKEFSADTRAEAERAASCWWAEQHGLVKVSGWILPLADPARPQWTATIIYKSVEPERAASSLH